MSKTNTKTNETPETVIVAKTWEEVVKEQGNISKAIRFLATQAEYKKADGTADRGKIAKFSGKIYQHVRNVLNTPVKKSA